MLTLSKPSFTVLHAVAEQARRQGDRPFCSFASGDQLTFAELESQSNALASGLATLGVGPGERVMMLARNSRAFILTWLATMKRGAIFVPVNTELVGAFLEHQVRNCEPRTALVDADLRPSLDTVAIDGLGVSYTVVLHGVAAPLPGSESRDFAALLATEARPEDVLPASPADVCTIMYTSGTTGPSKGVLMPQAHCLLYGYRMVRAFEITDQDTMYICMPFFHAMGLLIQFVGALVAATRTHVVERFSASTWLHDIRRTEATVTFGLGVIPEFIYRQPASVHDRDHRLRKMVAVPIGEEWGSAFEERFGVKLLQGYGMTECNIPMWSRLDDPLIPGCAGPVMDDLFDLQIVDPETDESLPVGQVGEVVVRPKEAFGFMAGYYRMPERTVEAWRNLWFHTGDAGRLDEQNRLHFIDRIKDCIRRRGENISSYEIEQVLNECAGVAESAVVGVRTADAGGEEEVKAVIVTSGEPPAPEGVIEWCATRMPRYAVPRFLEFVVALDKTPSGKLKKQGLKEAGLTANTWDRETAGHRVL